MIPFQISTCCKSVQKVFLGLVDDTLNLKFHNFAKIRVKIPGLEEQRLIREILSTADEEIEAFDAMLKTLEKQKRGLMQKLLTGEVRVKP